MSFGAPLYLAGLAAIPLALVAYAVARRRRRRYALRFTGVAVLASVAGSRSAWRRWLPLALFLTALASLAVALARPETTVAVPRDRAAVVLVSDASASMNADDVSPTRLDAARMAAGRFLDQVPEGLRVGLVGFSSAPTAVTGPTAELDQVRGALAELTASGSTATGDALAAALSLMRDPGRGVAPGAVVLLSDGATTTGREPEQVAERARRLGIPVYTVALGTPEGIIPRPDGGAIAVPPDPATMVEIAELSGGEAYSVDEADELARVYERLGSEIGSRDEVREISAAFAAGGLALLVAASGFALRWRGALP